MKLIKTFKLFLVAAVLTTASGCETFDLDQTDNPSTLPADKLDPVYVFNSVQLNLPDFINSANSFTQRVTRQMAMTGGTSYDNAFAPVNFDANWTNGYLLLNSIKQMEPKANENNQFFILGASKVIRCYVLLTMVDMYGDIPYSDALQGNANRTPKYDDSEEVYAGIYAELDEAIHLLDDLVDTSTGTLRARDLYYGSETGAPNKTGWVTLAKTLKLKMLNNARLAGSFGDVVVADKATTLLADNDLIDLPGEDFTFKYGSERDLPNSRHPLYNDQYEFGTGAYIANYFFWVVSKEKGGITDPREAFYFYKQKTLSGSNTSSASLPCKTLARPVHFNDTKYSSFFDPLIRAPYCISDSNVTLSSSFGSSYLGRDHGDASGIPQDDDLRSVVGLYPAGGAYGTPGIVNDGPNAGLRGALGEGIMPMVMSSYVNFIKAELALKLNLASPQGDAKTLFLLAVRQSIERVVTPIGGYPALSSTQTTAINTNKEAYIDFLNLTYDGLSDDGKLELIIKEYYIASWGNGIEPYNNYRRTGYPSNFQPTLEENPGAFYNTAYYAGASVNNNPNAPNNVRTKKVFWDKLGIALH